MPPDGCSLGAVDDTVRDNDSKLARLLQGREGWRLEVQDGEFYWCFGVKGAARLTVLPEWTGFLMHLPEAKAGEEELRFPGIESVEAWLVSGDR